MWRRRLIRMANIRIISVVVFAILSLVTIAFLDIITPSDGGPLDTSARDDYLSLEFIPKYKVADCVVTFKFLETGTKEYQVKDVDYAFVHYLSKHEPRVGTTIIELAADKTEERYRIAFADQCDRKEEIFRSMASYVEDFYDNDISIQRVPTKEPFILVGTYWLDSPDYNPSYWPTLHRAVRRDGIALMEMADFSKTNNHDTRHLYNSLAVHYLPDGPLKEKAKRLAETAFQKMLPTQQERSDHAIKYWTEKIQKYKTP